jgi:hypothetical protein
MLSGLVGTGLFGDMHAHRAVEKFPESHLGESGMSNHFANAVRMMKLAHGSDR